MEKSKLDVTWGIWLLSGIKSILVWMDLDLEFLGRTSYFFYCHRLTTLDQEGSRLPQKSRENIVKREEQQPLLSYGIADVAFDDNVVKDLKTFPLHTFIPSRIDIVFTSEKNRLNYLAAGPILNI